MKSNISDSTELFVGKSCSCGHNKSHVLCVSVIPMVTVLPDGLVRTILCNFLVGFNAPFPVIVASVFTLTVLAVERYNAVVKPLQVLQLSRKTVRYAIAGP